MDLLPNELIDEIGINIELPVDIVRFSLVCKDFYNCANKYKINWFAKMRSVINEIDAIEYRICRNTYICDHKCDDNVGNYDLDVRSCRCRNLTGTVSYNTSDDFTSNNWTNDSVLRIDQVFPINEINSHRKKRLQGRKYERDIFDMRNKCVHIELLHDDFSSDRYQYIHMYLNIYH